MRDTIVAEVPSFKREIALLVGDAQDSTRLDEIVSQVRVVLTTAGPYTLYGKKLVESCARNGVHYLDLTGEPPFMHECMSLQKLAESTGTSGGSKSSKEPSL